MEQQGANGARMGHAQHMRCHAETVRGEKARKPTVGGLPEVYLTVAKAPQKR
jgi:hypothetical protein